MTSSPFSLRVMARLRRLMTVTMTMACEREECAFISVDAKMRFWSPRCNSARQSFVLRTYRGGRTGSDPWNGAVYVGMRIGRAQFIVV